MSHIKKENLINDWKKDVDAFGLTEAIVSILLLAILVAFSTLFITKRLQTNYRANLIDAVNDEIKRDIQRVKYEFWKAHLKLSNNTSVTASTYEVTGPNGADCNVNVIGKTMSSMPSLAYSSWTPNGNTGELKNNVFKGRPVTISRSYETTKPFSYSSGGFDDSVLTIEYTVTFNGKGGSGFNQGIGEVWTSIDMTSEAYGWCPAK